MAASWCMQHLGPALHSPRSGSHILFPEFPVLAEGLSASFNRAGVQQSPGCAADSIAELKADCTWAYSLFVTSLLCDDWPARQADAQQHQRSHVPLSSAVPLHTLCPMGVEQTSVTRQGPEGKRS